MEVQAGYSAAFLTLGGVAAAAFVLYWVAMPETRHVTATDATVAASPHAPSQPFVATP